MVDSWSGGKFDGKSGIIGTKLEIGYKWFNYYMLTKVIVSDIDG